MRVKEIGVSMRLWDDELEAARPQIRAESKAFTAQFPGPEDDTGTAVERAQARRVAESALVLRSAKGTDRTIVGPSGPLRLREFRPDKAVGAMLHIHGGGWMTGEPELTDLLNEALCESLGLAIVSVEYRLAPEHPYPAGPDDCEAAALWLIENAAREYGTERLLIGGESAGAHLSAVTLLRLRDRHGLAGRFCGANLVFGPYDLGHTPSARGVGLEPGTDILDPLDMEFMVSSFAPGRSFRGAPSAGPVPLFAALHDMPPALFTVGTADHLIDDTLFLASVGSSPTMRPNSSSTPMPPTVAWASAPS